MLETVILILIFIMGAYFGSFFTLATYRLPNGENITHVHSYCPSCNHRLGLLDLVPVFSYIFLRGKCRYCKKEIGKRYFLFEIITGIVFVLFTISLKLDIYNLTINNMIYVLLVFMYFSSLFILAGIEKEKGIIQKSVLIYGIIVSIIYMIYSYILATASVYEYVIYFIFIIVLFLLDTLFLKRNLEANYVIQILILIANMLIFSGMNVVLYTITITILSIGIKNIIVYFKNEKANVIKAHIKTPFAFLLCISNILVIIVFNFLTNYMVM